MNKYWFYLKSSVYVEFKHQHIFLYDTSNGNYLEATSHDFINLVEELYEDGNLGVILVDDMLLTIPAVKNYVEKILEKDMGSLINIEEMPVKPISLVPILSLKKDIDKLLSKEDALPYLHQDLGKYLLELNIHLNSNCALSCPWCNKYDKQFLCCSRDTSMPFLSLLSLKRIFEQIQYLPISTINILGGDIFQYEHLQSLDELGKMSNKVLNVYCHYKHFSVYNFKGIRAIHLIIPFPVDVEKLQTVYAGLGGKCIFHFIIENKNHYMQVQSIISAFRMNEDMIKIHPFYNGKNIDFFEDFIYLDKEDILCDKASMRDILRNKKLNINTFGGLHILPDGKVKGNLEANVIGNILNQNITEIIFNELKMNTAWRRVRTAKPCCDCIFQCFCPSPSNYERVIERPNLCHVKSEK